jgi:hypothetical protein
MNIKQKLEAEAQGIVANHRESGGDIHDLIAKQASELGYQGEQVKSLTWLVNRHAFKMAMSHDKKDEMDLANAETVLFRMNRPVTKQASAVTPAARPSLGLRNGFSGNAHSGGNEKMDYGPALRKKLATRDQELRGEIRLLTARVRQGLGVVERMAPSIKRAGLDMAPSYLRAIAQIPEAERYIMEVALEKASTLAVPFTEHQLRMYLPRALEETKEMAKAACEVQLAGQDLADRQERLGRVRSQMFALRDGLEV